MTDKPSSHEEEYFARENAEKLRKLAAEHRSKLAGDERERLRRAHWMRCPSCGMDLRTVEWKGLQVDRCFSCNGTFLKAGELEKLVGQKGEVTKALLRLFEHSRTP